MEGKSWVLAIAAKKLAPPGARQHYPDPVGAGRIIMVEEARQDGTGHSEHTR
jgi:hypothetical protein